MGQLRRRLTAGSDLAPLCEHVNPTLGRKDGVHVSLTRVSTGDQPIENASVIAEEMVGWLREIDGFEGLVVLSRPGTTLGLTFWQAREIAERHRQARMEFLERMTSVADLQIEEVQDYEVTFASVGSPAVDTAG